MVKESPENLSPLEVRNSVLKNSRILSASVLRHRVLIAASGMAENVGSVYAFIDTLECRKAVWCVIGQ